MADAARYAAMSDPDANPAFRRVWEDPEPPPRPFLSVGEATRRVLPALNPASETRLARQIREVFGP